MKRYKVLGMERELPVVMLFKTLGRARNAARLLANAEIRDVVLNIPIPIEHEKVVSESKQTV